MYDIETHQPLTNLQRRLLQLALLEEQLKLSTSPKGRLELLSQVLTVKMDLRQFQAMNGAPLQTL